AICNPVEFKSHQYAVNKSESCDSNPCFGNATCQEKNQGESFTCLCPRNYTGQKCEILLKKHTWVQANSAPVCIGTKNDTFGTFKARFTGKLKTIKLIHLSGGVAWSGGPNYEGNWGDNYSKKFEIHVTDENNNRIAPPSYYPYRYTLPGQNFMNKYLVFPDFNPALDVIPDKVFRIWHDSVSAEQRRSTSIPAGFHREGGVYLYRGEEIIQKVQANTSPVCFGTKNDSFGLFKSPIKGSVKSIQMVHISGGVAWDGGPDYEENWGDSFSELFEVHITNEKNERIAPPVGYFMNDTESLRYSIPGESYNATNFTFPEFSPRLTVYKDQVFRVWYGEDLVNYDEENNTGKTCANVYMEYRQS
ncbi:hypothetical protein AC249_AIPGENE294, partial [Exaiptasia diaphana]